MIVLDVASAALLLAGTAFAVTGAVGLLRLPDVFGRMHAATKPTTLGVTLCLLGAALRVEDLSDITKLLLAAAFFLLTAPVSGHLIGRAAHDAGAAQSEHTVIDELDSP